jgi:hypothetical protein
LCILTAYLTQLINIERCAHCELLALSHFVFRVFIYSIQGVSGKKSISEGDNIRRCNKKSSYKDVSNSECLPA